MARGEGKWRRVRKCTSAGSALGLAVLLAACTGDAPCSHCPPIEGRYAVTLDPDTGVAASADCQAVGITGDGGELVITRQGSALSGSYGARDDLSGVLTDSNRFTLSGTSTDGGTHLDSTTFEGRYVADGRDGGHHLTGYYTATVHGPERTCDFTRDFTGAAK